MTEIQTSSKPAVILIHGLAASAHDWNELIPELESAGYHCHAVDLLGHGSGEKPADIASYHIDNVYAHFSNWLNSINVSEPFILIGHSLGGYIAIQYALNNPARVQALILGDPLYRLPQLPLLMRLNYQNSFFSSSLIDHTPEWLIKWAVDLTSLSIRNGHRLSDTVRKQTATDYKRAHPGIFNIIHTIDDLSVQLNLLTLPTLVIWGAEDRTLSPVSFQLILEKIPNAKGAAIPGAGHVPHQSHPGNFNRLVLDFLAGVTKTDHRPDGE